MNTPNTDIGWLEEKMRHRHVAYGVLAVAVSLLIHAIILARFPGITFGAVVKAAKEKYRTPVRVERVQAEPGSAADRPERFRAENPNLATDLPGEAMAQRKGLDQVLIEPRILPGQVRAGESRIVGMPSPAVQTPWDPRREVLQIEEKVVADAVSALPRRYVPGITRSARTADIVPPADRTDLTRAATGREADFFRVGSPTGRVDAIVLGGSRRGGRSPVAPVQVSASNELAKIVQEKPEEITGAIPLDRFLKARVWTYSSMRDLRHMYCRIEIQRAGAEVLPVLPKDVALVQDCSASMTEQKLHFCREGLVRALSQIGPEDRFNVFMFRDRAEKCFPTWVARTPETEARARAFVSAMRSEGNTDIYGSIRELLALEREPGRPLIALVVSDGIPTVGITSSPRIIAQFSRDNAGGVSIFALGTIRGANAYLLDLLSYCNRGDSDIVTRGRWDIPAAIEARAKGVARPVLTDTRFRFARASEIEAYPVQTSHLYLDRPLVLYGRFPRGLRRLVFQAVGQAGPRKGDMVFDLDLETAATGGEDIRENWAWQKIYHLIAEHARTRNPETLREVNLTARSFRIRLPYGEAVFQ